MNRAKPTETPAPSGPRKPIPAAAERDAAQQPQESRGRDGPDPVRYGDWEVKGIASDF